MRMRLLLALYLLLTVGRGAQAAHMDIVDLAIGNGTLARSVDLVDSATFRISTTDPIEPEARSRQPADIIALSSSGRNKPVNKRIG